MSFKKGDVVTVYNQTLNRRPIIEGRATVLKPTGIDGQYWVRFADEDGGGKSARFVFPDVGANRCQSDPEGYLAAAVADWEAQMRDYEHRVATLQN